MIGLVDADILIYRCGFAAEKRGKRQLENGETEHYREVAPASHAIQNLRTVIEALQSKFDKLEFYLSGKNNFRKDVATIRPYKGNRSEFSKPVHYDELRDFLVARYGAQVVDGMEADDAIGIRATAGSEGSDKEVGRKENSSNGSTCVISTDKDLKQIPGYHYNWVRDEYAEVSEREGLRVFYKQMLTGDITDNIPGIEGVGPVTAGRIVDPFTKERGMWQAVKEEWYLRYPEGYHGTAVDRVLEEIGKLLWIQRTGRLTWEAP